MYWTLNGPEYEQCNNFTLINKVELYTTIDSLMFLFKLYNTDVKLLIGFLTLSFIDFGRAPYWWFTQQPFFYAEGTAVVIK